MNAATGTADEAGLRAAVGDLWGRYEEFAPLGAFLTKEANAGLVRLAGLDDGLGVRHATFANDTMIGELTGRLPGAQRETCARGMRARVEWDNRSPSYGANERAALRDCIAAIRARVPRGSDQATLVAALDRLLVRDLQPAAAQFAGRERTMYVAFEEVMAPLPRGSKAIVWGATAHLARDSRSWPALPDAPSMGAMVHRRYGRGAFTLGFSAAGGEWRRSPSQPVKAWSAAPADAIELRALRAGGDSAYLTRVVLRAAGTAPARMWNNPFVRARWDRVVDGLVVFRTDRPPTLRR